MLINYISLFLMWTLLSESLSRAEQGNTNSLQLTQEFSHLFRNKHVVLIKPGNQTGERLRDLIKIRNVFSRSLEFFTSIHDFTQFFTSFDEGTTQNLRMTTVYTDSDSIVTPDLNAMLSSSYRGMLTWLCEISSERSISKLKDVKAPLNSKFFFVKWADNGSAVIFEMYDIPRGETQMNYFGEWDDENGLRVEEKEFGERRKNLKGTVTKFFIYNNLGYDKCNRELFMKSTRYYFECYRTQQWLFIGSYLNFTTEFQNYETSDEANTMTDLLSAGSCDTGSVGVVLITLDMEKDNVTFLPPKWRSRISLLAPVAGNEISLSTFLKPFSHKFWMALVAWLTFAGIVLAVLVYMVDSVASRQKVADHFSNLYIPFQAICSQGCTLETAWTGLRIILIICYIIPVIMMTAYSGGIISSLANPEKIPFRTLKQFVENGEYKITTVWGLHLTTLLKEEPVFELSRKKSLIVNTFPRDSEEAFNDLCTKKRVLFEDRKLLSIRAPECKVYYIKDVELHYFVGTLLSAHFPLIDPITVFSLKLIERGVNQKDVDKVALDKYNFERIDADSLGMRADTDLSLNPASLENLILLYAILLTGMALSVLVFLFEVITNREE